MSGTTVASAVVVLIPAQDPPMRRRHPRPAVMDQSGQTFIPSLLLAQVGQTVQFLNSDDELHNINVKESATKTQAFNVAIPMGQAYRYTFTREGFYDVTCDIHPAMSASIFVASSPYATVADGDGRFSLSDVPPGEYRLTVYAAGQPTVRPIVVTSPRTDVTVN